MRSDFSLVSLMLDLSLIQFSTQTGTLGISLSYLAFFFFFFCYLMQDRFPFCLKSAYTSSLQSLPSMEFTSCTPKCSLSFQKQKCLKAKKRVYVGEIPFSAIYLISDCRLSTASFISVY